MCSQHGYNVISNNHINEACLNNSKLHALKSKGNCFPVGFIKFLRARQSSGYVSQQYHNYFKKFSNRRYTTPKRGASEICNETDSINSTINNSLGAEIPKEINYSYTGLESESVSTNSTSLPDFNIQNLKG